MRRHDYAVDVLGGSAGAHYISGYREFDGIVTSTRRRVFAMGPNKCAPRGRVWMEAALLRGNRVAATARDVKRLARSSSATAIKSRRSHWMSLFPPPQHPASVRLTNGVPGVC
jgi:hypothetical protein